MHCLSEYLTSANGWFILAEIPKWLNPIVNRFWSVLVLAIGLGALIFVHEFGHFIAAKLMRIKVEVFSIGFGRRLFGFKLGETDYRFSAFPLGGYVKMLGQDDLHPEARVDDQRAYCNKSVGQRFVVIFAGVAMNIICALLLFVILFRFVGVDFPPAEVGIVSPYKPAYKAMFQKVRDGKAHVWMHLCGNISEILPDLVDIGLNVLNPVQPQALDVHALARDFGGRICFNGGIDVQGTMVRGKPEEVKREVHTMVDMFGRFNGGYIGGMVVGVIGALIGGFILDKLLLETMIRVLSYLVYESGVNIIAGFIGGYIAVYIMNRLTHDKERKKY